MDMVTLASGLLLLISFLICLFALRYPIILKIAIRNLFRRRKSAVLAVLTLAVGAAVVTGALSVGDSLESAVVRSTYENLNNVDLVARSVGVFNMSIAAGVFPSLGENIDAVAPLIIMSASVKNVNTSLRESRINVIGFNESFLDFGKLRLVDGSSADYYLRPNEVLVNRRLADKLNAIKSHMLNISFRTPEFSFETVYSPVSTIVKHNFRIRGIVENRGLGRFQLSSSGIVPENIYMRLDTLQGILNLSSKINTVIVSNAGDMYEGIHSSPYVLELLKRHFDDAVGYEDLGFEITTSDYVKIDRKEIFFEESFRSMVQDITSNSQMVEAVSYLTSYFFNWVGNETSFVAYSVATGFDPLADSAFGLFERSANSEMIPGEIADDEAIINEYVASKLNIGEGSRITLNYSVYDRTFNEVYRYADFIVKYVINLTGKADDSNLMPPFPGIKGKASCGDWDPPIPIDVRKMMDYDDLDYWIRYGGSPKVYITLGKARELWANDLGDTTTIKIKPSEGTNVTTLAQWIGAELNNSISYADAGIIISPIKQEGVDSASGVHIVTETYLAFGSVVMISGMLLILLFVGTTAEERKKEMGIIRALGASRRKTSLCFTFEGFFLALFASFFGSFAGILLALISVHLTNTYWSNLVEGNQITLTITLPTFFVGMVAGLVVSLLTFILASYLVSGMRIVEALRDVSAKSVKKRSILPMIAVSLGVLFSASGFLIENEPSSVSLVWLVGPCLIIIGFGFLADAKLNTSNGSLAGSLSTILYTIIFDAVFLNIYKEPAFLLFFASGFVVIASASAIWLNIGRRSGELISRNAVSRIAFSNPARKPGKSGLTIAMFGIVVFTLVALAMNISGQEANIENAVAEQSGGYQVLAEATTAIRFDLGDAGERSEHNISEFPRGTEVLQFSTFGSLGGTCTNLNNKLPPRLIGANETFILENTFRFSSSMHHEPSDSSGSWSEIYEVWSDGSIPIIGDTNTIVWIYGKSLGDKIEIVDEAGRKRNLIVTGILTNSIFSGSVFLSNENLDELFPTRAEYNLFLFRTDNPENLISILEEDMDSYGMDATLIEEMVRDNLSVEWSYMSLFQVLLLVGLVVGTAGLALASARSVVERRHEIGILRSLGFTRRMILETFFLENLLISLSGTLIGLFFGLLISLEFFGPIGGQGYGIHIPWLVIILIISAVLLATLFSTLGPAIRASKLHVVDALRIDE